MDQSHTSFRPGLEEKQATHLSAIQHAHQMCFLICFSTGVNKSLPLSSVQLSASWFIPRSVAYIRIISHAIDHLSTRRRVCNSKTYHTHCHSCHTVNGRPYIFRTDNPDSPVYNQPCSIAPDVTINHQGMFIYFDYTDPSQIHGRQEVAAPDR